MGKYRDELEGRRYLRNVNCGESFTTVADVGKHTKYHRGNENDNPFTNHNEDGAINRKTCMVSGYQKQIWLCLKA